jgi:glutamate N-acetyltransferase/amino-acid N-acetyltransferase
MAVGLKPITALEPVAGVRLATLAAGIRRKAGADLVVMELASGTRAAGRFTRNAFCAAPVTIARDHLQRDAPRFLLINAGNANAGTGAEGLRDALRCCRALAEKAGCRPEQVLPFSTGVIGEPLPVAKIVDALDTGLERLQADGWVEAASGIMTTDTVPKGVSRRVTIGDATTTLTGIVKGAGMIRPDMATLLAFLATDAQVAPELLERSLREAADASFNRITIDGDTSTNDACILVATGRGALRLTEPDEAFETFSKELRETCLTLAQAVVRDGEGATKFVTILVEEAEREDEALAVAYTVAHSPLVKTALFAADPNWGRILAAVGRAGLADLALEDLGIWLGAVQIVRNGGRDPAYTETAGQMVMEEPEITIRIALGRGSASAQVWTTDLSYDYVRINAEYRT